MPGCSCPGRRCRRSAGWPTELAVSRSTVTAALDILRADGVLPRTRAGARSSSGSTTGAAGEAANRMAVHLVEGAGGIDLAVGNPADVSHLPPVSVDVADLLASGAGAGFQPLGLPALRQAIADLHTAAGLHTDVEEVHITSGAHQAISLVDRRARRPARGRRRRRRPATRACSTSSTGLGHDVAPLRSDRPGSCPESLDRGADHRRGKVVYVQAGAAEPDRAS